MSRFQNGRRVAVISGLRTPFIRSGTSYGNLTSLDLGKLVTVELLNRTEIDPGEIDKVFFGNVVSSVHTPNLAREIALGSGIPPTVPAFTVTSACVSSGQAFTSAVDSIMSGDSDAVLTGGADSGTDISILSGAAPGSKIIHSSKGGNLISRAKPLFKMRGEEVVPSVAFLPERYTGRMMGEAAEKAARRYKISREEQDEFAMRSHALASRAQEEGVFEDELIHTYVPPDFSQVVSRDSGVMDDISPEYLARYEPVFDSEFGTVTVGNSSILSDGASALLLMSEDKAKALGYKPLAYVRAYAYSALDPSDDLLMSAAFSTPAALDRARVSLSDIDLVEIHEAFSSQVIANLRALASRGFAKEKLGKAQAVGEIDMERLNVSGGSIAIGHPLSATGGRIIMTLIYRMTKRSGKLGLVSMPASGGIGVSIVFEKE
ncbi:MAG: acetyl-CoA C-acyltransferase [Deltaproteobacteria bacterium]